MVDRRGVLDPHGTDESRQEVSVCGVEEVEDFWRGKGGRGVRWVALEGANNDGNGAQKRRRWVLRECL